MTKVMFGLLFVFLSACGGSGGGADWVREQIVKQYPKLKVVYDQL